MHRSTSAKIVNRERSYGDRRVGSVSAACQPEGALRQISMAVSIREPGGNMYCWYSDDCVSLTALETSTTPTACWKGVGFSSGPWEGRSLKWSGSGSPGFVTKRDGWYKSRFMHSYLLCSYSKAIWKSVFDNVKNIKCVSLLSLAILYNFLLFYKYMAPKSTWTTPHGILSLHGLLCFFFDVIIQRILLAIFFFEKSDNL